MEIKIGVTGVAREFTLDIEAEPKVIRRDFDAAVVSGQTLSITDSRGRVYDFAGKYLAYIELGETVTERVGFGFH